MNLQIAVAVAMGGAVFAAVLFTLLDSTEAIKRLFSFKNRFAETVIFAFIPLSLSFGVFALVLVLAVRLFKRLFSVRKKLSNYEQYRRDIIHRWGKDEVARDEAKLMK